MWCRSVLIAWTVSCVGLLQPNEAIEPHLSRTVPPTGTPKLTRAFSAFPLTSHLHTPTVRLVSLHPLLSVSLACLRVPEIHDDFAWRVFISRNTTVQEVATQVVDELGLTKSLPVPGGGNLDYVIEEAWASGDDDSKHILSI
jgi:diaphanous 1